MSNTTITPTAGAAALAGVAAALLTPLLLVPGQGQLAVAGVAPTATSVSPAVPPDGLPVSWRSLGQGAAGAASPLRAWRQAKLIVSGTFNSYANLVIQGSPDGVTWTNLAMVGDAVSPGCGCSAPGVQVYAPGGGVIFLSALDQGWQWPYLRPAVANGDNTTAITITGNLSRSGCV
jgi:hypothetical protein